MRKSDENARGARRKERERRKERHTHTHTHEARRCTDGMKNEKEQLRWRVAVNRD